MCEHTAWEIGHVFMRSSEQPDTLVPSSVWSSSADRSLEPFREETATITFTEGHGIIGRAMRDRRPVVFDSLGVVDFLRKRSASQTGLKRGLAAPVLVGDEVVAVLEFYTRSEQPFDRAFIELVAYAGMQIGRVVDRERARVVLEQKTEALKEQSMVDELTALYNRRGFLELADERRSAASRTSQRVFILFADLDGMKKINDELGHHAGDAALVETAGVLKRTLRTADIVARLGGDEFVALTCETGTFDSAALLARLEAEVARVNTAPNRAFQLGISFGITGPAAADEDVKSLLKRADAAMYEKKSARKRAR